MKTKHTETEQVKTDFATAHRIIAFESMHEGTWNHLSCLVPGNETEIFVTPGSTHFSSVFPEDILTMDNKGEVTSGPVAPNQAAWCLHYPIHVARPDAVCVIHLHSLYSTALMMRRGVKLDERASQAAVTLLNQIAYIDVYDGLLRAYEEGAEMAKVLGDKNVLVLRNHGFISVGRSIAEALERAYTFERACHFQLLATADRSELGQIPKAVAQAICDEENKFMGGYFRGMKKLLSDSEDTKD